MAKRKEYQSRCVRPGARCICSTDVRDCERRMRAMEKDGRIFGSGGCLVKCSLLFEEE
jgi:hypothetical protein